MRSLLIIPIFCIALGGIAFAQTGSNVKSGLASNSDNMNGPNIDVVNGTNANGTPRALSPGSSMTVGAGNSTMLPGITGAVPGLHNHLATPTVTGVTHGTTQTKPNP